MLVKSGQLLTSKICGPCAVLSRSTPACPSPSAAAARMARSSCPLLTAMSVTDSSVLPTAAADSAIAARNSCRRAGIPGSAGEFGWAGAAKTYYWVDPLEQIAGIFMTQSMSSFDLPEMDLRGLAYGAIID